MNLTGRVDTVVQLLDIFPTIAAMFGKEVVTDGRSLFEAIKTKTIDDSMAISTTFNDIANFGIRWRQWYYVINLKDNSEELFNIIKAPLKDVAAKNTFFRGRFITWLNKYDRLGVESQAIDLKKLPADIRKDLKSLGYID
jgi:arylsulfatase A-like enzyme